MKNAAGYMDSDRTWAVATVRLSLVILATLAVPNSFSQTALTSVDAYVKKKMLEMHIPGLSQAVVRGGEIIEAAGYGVANVETNTPATPQTVYKTASLSKAVIGAATGPSVLAGRTTRSE